MKKYKILAIDTSCDDTSVAVMENDKVLISIVSSQIDLHAEWGGVVPHIARKEHERNLPICVKKALARAGIKQEEIDFVAVTEGPGLAPALEVGVRFAKEFAKKYAAKIVGVNHMEGHLLSGLLRNRKGKYFAGNAGRGENFPLLGLLVSGGHTEIIYAEKLGDYKKIGETQDDAVGEAYDKVARALGLGYPGGPIVERLAESGDGEKVIFPRPMLYAKNYNFSYSGLKTAVAYKIKELGGFEKLGSYGKPTISDICASFEEAALDLLVYKMHKATETYKVKKIALGGGVSSNLKLRKKLRKKIKISLIAGPKKFCMDNAAMIGIAGYYKFLRGEIVENIDELDRKPNLDL